MVSQYFYLISSLPILKLNEKSQVTADEFLQLCSPWLPEVEFSAVANSSIKEPFRNSYSSAVLEKWEEFEKNLRNEVVLIRARNLKLESAGLLRKTTCPDAYLSSIVKDITDDPSPLSAEKKLTELRWNFLDQLEAVHHFDIGLLIIYHLKLQLIERQEKMNKKRGHQVFEFLHNSTYYDPSQKPLL